MIDLLRATTSPHTPTSSPRIRAVTRPGLLVLAVALLVSVIGLSGCSNAVQGNASKHPPAAQESDLQAGNYPTTPRPPLGEAGEKQGPYVEARRMGNYVVIPSEVDPTLTGGFDKIGTFNGPFKGADSIGAIYDTTFPEGASRNYITGFMVSRDREGPGVPNLHNAVLRYASPEDATAAADELGATTAPDANKYFGSEPPAPRPIEIPRHPDARGITFGSSESSVTVVSFLAHGPFVLTQQSYSKNGLAEALELVSGTLDKQIPLIDKFKPTPPDQIAQLPLDQDGLLARTVEPAVDRRGQFRFGLYEVHGFLTYSDDPAGDEKVLNDAGVDLIALAGTDVFRARDAEGAQTILDKWSEIRAEDSEPTDGVPGLPDSRCFKTVVSAGTDSERTHIACMFTVDRYLVDLGSFQKRAAHQKAAAQYLLLTAS